MVIVKKEKRFNIVSLTDWHAPYHDPKALAVALEFCKHIQPEIIIIHEAHDFYALSRFNKDPRKAHGYNLQKEFDIVNIYFGELRGMCPKSKIYLLESNHMNRLEKYLNSAAPGLKGLRSLEMKTLIAFDKYDVHYRPDFSYRDFVFKHGNVVRKHSSYTAKAEFEKEGTSGASGHSHRLGAHYTTKRGGKYVWVESGCLCKLNPEYIDGTANWQQGLSLVSFKENSKHFIATAIPIINHELMWGDVSFKA